MAHDQHDRRRGGHRHVHGNGHGHRPGGAPAARTRPSSVRRVSPTAV
ncbi:hypothetical protein FHS34_005171 [Streptomyces echinatus]|uniref:Uncharacterized protein n=1 Tax=Streptomyces echinatus TaxID=67293 RepID=A0A7W9UTK6_9ACTN|nr:hypothetical protein [Streptomyces echinatus]